MALRLSLLCLSQRERSQMALSRLFLSGTRLHLHRKGFPRPTRLFSSSSGEKEYKRTHSEVFAKATQVQSEVEGSLNMLKGIFTKVKKKVFSKHQSEKTLASESLDAKEDSTNMTTTEVTKIGEILDVELDDLKSRLQVSESMTDSNNHEKDPATCRNTMSNESSGDSIRPMKSSRSPKIDELGEKYEQLEADPRIVVASGSDQEAVSKPLFCMLNRSVTEEEKATRDSNEEILIKDEMCQPNTKLSTSLASNECSEQTKISSSCSIVRMTMGNQKSLRSDSADITVDRTSFDDRKKDERLDQGNDSENYKVDHGTAEYPSREREEVAKALSHLIRGSDGGRVTRTSDVAGSAKDASMEYEWVPPDGSRGAKDFSSSGSADKVLVSSNLLDDDTSTFKTSSAHATESSRDGFSTIQIKSLINQVKSLPKDSSQTRYGHGISISDKINILNNCSLSEDKNQAVVTDKTLKHPVPAREELSLAELFVRDKRKNQVQEKSKKKGPKEKYMSQMILKEKDCDTLTKADEIVTCDTANLDSPDDVTKKVPLKIVDSHLRNVCENVSDPDDAAFWDNNSEPTPQIPLTSKKEPLKRDSNPLLFTEKGRDQTYLLVRFVPKSLSETTIQTTFERYGPIDEIRFITSSNDRSFKNAYIRFKTKKGMREALAITDPVVGLADVILEAASPSTYTSSRIHVPDPIGIPGIPPSLVKNPTRTVMVKGLAHNVASQHLEDAFSFCGACITGFFMGSSSSIAYIEFETVSAKEKAIAACSVPISGSKLSIHRIDAPSTTVVRISNARGKVNSICSSYGKVKNIFIRSPTVVDVHYRLTEWPAMVNILNSLNGQIVDGQQWIAQPAPVIPPEILKYLWSQPDGRRRVYSVIENLCQKIEENSMAEVKNLTAKYYEEKIEKFQL